MAELAIDNVREYLGIAVRVCAEASVGLHQIVVKHLQQAYSTISSTGQQNWRQFCRVSVNGAQGSLARRAPKLFLPGWYQSAKLK